MAQTSLTQSRQERVPVIPYELLRLVAQRSTPPCAALMRRLNSTTSTLITTQDLVNVTAAFYWILAGPDAVKCITYDPAVPQIMEKIYILLVRFKAHPLPPDSSILWDALIEGHLNIPRAIAAAGGDIIHHLTHTSCRGYPAHASIVYLVEELGVEDLDYSLCDAVKFGRAETVRYLIQCGANLDAVTESDVCAAAESWYSTALAVLVEMGIRWLPGSTDALCDILVKGRMCDGTVETIKVLIRGGANIHAIVSGDVCLVWAVKNGWWEVVDFLLRTDEDLFTLAMCDLFRAVLDGDVVKVRELLEPGGLWAPMVNRFDGAALRLAVREGDEAMVKLLLKCGAHPHQNTLDELFAFRHHWDLEKRKTPPSLPVLSLLIAAGAKPTQRTMVYAVSSPIYCSALKVLIPLCHLSILVVALDRAVNANNREAIDMLVATGAKWSDVLKGGLV
ncbi:hypothetical protein HK104_000436 [Borealophlyctis nickersoniae]|nr:hypothetical protein HK104_000436 [Borealophlyctis nickersoniae]